MELQEIIIAGVIIIVAAFVVSFIFTPTSGGAHDTHIQILNKGDLGANSTIYIKLTNDEKASLSDRTVHVQLTDKKGNTVYNHDAKTHATGVAMTQLSNVNAGEYTLNVTYDGDSNYTGCSVSKKVKVESGFVNDTIDNSTLTRADIQDIASSQSQSSSDSSSDSGSYSPSSSSSNSQPSSNTPSQPSTPTQSSSDDSSDTYIDENGKEILPTYDENGKEIEPV